MEWFAPPLSRWGYPFILLVTFLEMTVVVGLFIPGGAAIGMAGFLAARGILRLKYVILYGFIGALLGDLASYLLGRYGVARFASRLGKLIFTRGREIERARRYFLKHGGKAVLLGRFTFLLRGFLPFAAGMSRMNPVKFLLYDALGAASWCALFSCGGFFLGEGWRRIERLLGATGMAVILLAALITLVYHLWRRRKTA